MKSGVQPYAAVAIARADYVALPTTRCSTQVRELLSDQLMVVGLGLYKVNAAGP